MLCFFCIIILQQFRFYSILFITPVKSYLCVQHQILTHSLPRYKIWTSFHKDFTKFSQRVTFSAFFQVSSLQNKLKILSCNRRKLIPWKKNKFCKAPLFKKNTIVALINLWILHSQYAGATGKKNSSNYYARLF